MEMHGTDGYFETSDYYTVCFSAAYSYRMYFEFKADSCVVVNDMAKFQEDLMPL